MGELIAVLSGKGGTGKTSLCAAMATALAKSGDNVLCIDCDVGLRNLDISLGLTEYCGLSFEDVFRAEYTLEQATRHPEYPQLAFLTAPANCAASDVDPEKFFALLTQASAWPLALLTGSFWSPALTPPPFGMPPGQPMCWS